MASLDGIVQHEFGKTVTLTLKDKDGNVQDVSAYTTITVYARHKRTHKLISATGSFTSDGTDGKIDFNWADGDLEFSGLWECNVKLERSGVEAWSEPFDMVVAKAVST